MKTQTYRVMAVILLVLVLASLSCQAEYIQKATQSVLPTSTATATVPPLPTPTVLNGQAVLAPVVAQMAEVQTMHLTSTLISQSGSEQESGVLEAWVKGKDQLYYKMTVSEGAIEFLMLDASGHYLKLPGNETWEFVPATGEATNANWLDVLVPIAQVQNAINPTLQPDDNLDGVECYHISYDIDVPGSLSDEDRAQVDPNSAIGKSDIWVGKNDSRIYKWILDISYMQQGVQKKIYVSTIFEEFNSPVFLPDPTP